MIKHLYTSVTRLAMFREFKDMSLAYLAKEKVVLRIKCYSLFLALNYRYSRLSLKIDSLVSWVYFGADESKCKH